MIGKSLLGENVFAFHLGDVKGKQIVLTGGIHAREYISTLFLLKSIMHLKNRKLNGGLWVVPLLNPDGVRLVLDGVGFIKDMKLKSFLIDVNDGQDFSFYKANANGVDLNVNFDARWGKGKSNTKTLGKENFIGYYKNSEVENLNIIEFLKRIHFDAHIAFHSKGEVIYYGFNKRGKRLKIEENFVNKISKLNGYLPVVSKESTGGLSDYVSQQYKKPSVTIELGRDELIHPINEKYLDEIYNKNLSLIENFLSLV